MDLLDKHKGNGREACLSASLPLHLLSARTQSQKRPGSKSKSRRVKFSPQFKTKGGTNDDLARSILTGFLELTEQFVETSSSSSPHPSPFSSPSPQLKTSGGGGRTPKSASRFELPASQRNGVTSETLSNDNAQTAQNTEEASNNLASRKDSTSKQGDKHLLLPTEEMWRVLLEEPVTLDNVDRQKYGRDGYFENVLQCRCSQTFSRFFNF